MNSYGSVALVSHAIYKLLHHMNWFSNDDIDEAVESESNGVVDADDHVGSNADPKKGQEG
jgi:hypothetical protein